MNPLAFAVILALTYVVIFPVLIECTVKMAWILAPYYARVQEAFENWRTP